MKKWLSKLRYSHTINTMQQLRKHIPSSEIKMNEYPRHVIMKVKKLICNITKKNHTSTFSKYSEQYN